MRKEVTIALAALMVAVATPALPEPGTVGAYTSAELLVPCQEGDNDSRSGAASELECEQYIMGFADALHQADMIGPGKGICLPEVNTADEVRWAFVRWVHGDYSSRLAMSSSEALLGAMREVFACSN